MASQSPHRDENVSAAPDISPGIVQVNEGLLRGLFNPDHVKEGEVLPTAIPLADLDKRGFSVHRLSHVNQDLLQHSIDKILSRMSGGHRRKFEGVARLETYAVRALTIEGARAFVVIDTALPCNAGHASIYAAKPSLKPSHLRELRKLLLPLLQSRMSVAEVFGRS